jgi:hypothetical protein
MDICLVVYHIMPPPCDYLDMHAYCYLKYLIKIKINTATYCSMVFFLKYLIIMHAVVLVLIYLDDNLLLLFVGFIVPIC